MGSTDSGGSNEEEQVYFLKRGKVEAWVSTKCSNNSNSNNNNDDKNSSSANNNISNDYAPSAGVEQKLWRTFTGGEVFGDVGPLLGLRRAATYRTAGIEECEVCEVHMLSSKLLLRALKASVKSRGFQLTEFPFVVDAKCRFSYDFVF